MSPASCSTCGPRPTSREPEPPGGPLGLPRPRTRTSRWTTTGSERPLTRRSPSGSASIDRSAARKVELAEDDGARLGGGLQARREVDRVADRRVVHPQRVPDPPHDDLAAVQAHPHLHDPLGAADRDGIGAERRRDVPGREDGPVGVVLVGQRGAEEGEEAVAQELGHDPLVAVDLGQRAGEELLDEAGHRLGADPLGRAGGVDDVAEEGGHGLALALEALREARIRSVRWVGA